MNEKIFEHVKKYNKSKGYGTEEEDIIETILDGPILQKEEIGEHRWWNEYWYVTEIDGMCIGYPNAITTGNMSAHEAGYNICLDDIQELQKVTKTITITEYEPV